MGWIGETMSGDEDNNQISSSARLAYWYLRLNGFLLLEDFVIHHEQSDRQRTDADLLGVRFAYRAENFQRPMRDDPKVADCANFCNVIIAEVKRGYCSLNGPWTNPQSENMQRVLRAIGFVPESLIEQAADSLYQNGRFDTERVTCRLMAFGDKEGKLDIPSVPQIYFDDMIRFIYRRFSNYRTQKTSVGNWAEDGTRIRDLFYENYRDREGFRQGVRAHFGLPVRDFVRDADENG